jgi:hypothetical protein
MFCLNCGAESQRVNAYCKRCGEWLPDLKSSRAKRGGEMPGQHSDVMLFLNGVSALVALCSAVILYAKHLGGNVEMNGSVALAASLCVSLAAWQVSAFLIGLKPRRRLKRRLENNQTIISGNKRQTRTRCRRYLPLCQRAKRSGKYDRVGNA